MLMRTADARMNIERSRVGSEKKEFVLCTAKE
jgi:hypothetical protein